MVDAVKFEAAGRTHVGMKRSHNEDSLRLCRDEDLYIVADGMGGHASGEIASQLSVETLAEFFRATRSDGEITWPYKMDKEKVYDENRMSTGIKLSNRRIFESASRDARLKGMGTTLVATFFHGDKCYIGHVGDSRVYVHRRNKLVLLTEDHSLLNDYIKMKKLTPEEIEPFPHKNVIVRALGMKETVQVDVSEQRIESGDVFLLCSDGLSGMITDEGMEQILNETPDLEACCDRLIEIGNQNGGTDNITVILVRCTE